MSVERRTCPSCGATLPMFARECSRCHTLLNSRMMLAGPDLDQQPSKPTCEFHPDRPASASCGGCHRTLCSSCEIGLLGQSYCQRCIYIYVDLPKVFEKLARESAERVRLAQEQERIAGELRIAHQMQARMLPQSPPAIPGLDVAGFSDPCREVGGDYFDYWILEDGRLALCIGDVTGKGVPAALLMAMVKSCLHVLPQDSASPGAILQALSSMVRSLGDRHQLMTFQYAILDPADRTVRLANAGHLYPYLVHSDGSRVEFLEANGLPLGAPWPMQYEEVSCTLSAGDRLIFSTDGVVEAHNTGGEMLGFDRLQELVRRTMEKDSHGAVHEILKGLRQFIGRAPLEDDVTLVAVRFSETTHAS